MVLNTIGIKLGVDLSENTILEEMVTPDQERNFRQFTHRGNPNDVQREYIGTFFSFVGRLSINYARELHKVDPEQAAHLTLTDFSEIMNTPWFRALIYQAMGTTNEIWGIAPFEGIQDMLYAEEELLNVFQIDSLYELDSSGNDDRPRMNFHPKVRQVLRQYIAVEGDPERVQLEHDPSQQGSSGCPVRHGRAEFSRDDTNQATYLTEGQIAELVMGDAPIANMRDDHTLVFHNRPVESLTDFFAEVIASTVTSQEEQRALEPPRTTKTDRGLPPEVKIAHVLIMLDNLARMHRGPLVRNGIKRIREITDAYREDIEKLKQANPRRTDQLDKFTEHLLSKLILPQDEQAAIAQARTVMRVNRNWVRRSQLTPEASALATLVIGNDKTKLSEIDLQAAEDYPISSDTKMNSAEMWELLFNRFVLLKAEA